MVKSEFNCICGMWNWKIMKPGNYFLRLKSMRGADKPVNFFQDETITLLAKHSLISYSFSLRKAITSLRNNAGAVFIAICACPSSVTIRLFGSAL